MAYDYSADSQRLELPNPYRIENLFQFIASAFYLACGVLSLLAARTNLDAMNVKFVVPLAVGIVLIGYGIRRATVGMQRLRFFFGRALPVGLAPELPNGAQGRSPAIDSLQADLRRGTLSFPEPVGALNGLLYNIFPRLILAPQPVQQLAQTQTRNGLVIALTLLSLLIAWLGFSKPQTAEWVGLFYFAFAAWLVLRPMTNTDESVDGSTGSTGNTGSNANKGVDENGVIALVVAAIIGPVVVAFFARYLPALPMTLQWQALFLLLAALVSVTLFFIALIKQLSSAPATTITCEVISLNINTHPAQLIGEFDRMMQQKWVEKIPNRRYARIDPAIDSAATTGSFAGEIFEETQPMPSQQLQSLSLAAAFGNARTRWLVLLNLFGLLMLCSGAIALMWFVFRFEAGMIDLSITAPITYSFVAFMVGRFCFNGSEQLWGRFDFVSEVIWLELSGQFTTARNRIGNEFSSQVQTESHGVHVDAMTMRVWTARIESVVFGKHARRWITAMNGQSENTSGLAGHLSSFARARSMFVAPTNSDDLGRLTAMQRTTAPAATASQQLAAGAAAVSKPVNYFCSRCGSDRVPEARFCGQCGTQFSDA